MTATKTLLQFQSPWQGRHGFARFAFDPTSGNLTQRKPVKPLRLQDRSKGGIDGLVLKPAWPTSRGLCLMLTDGTLFLHEIRNGRVRKDIDPVDCSAASFKTVIQERVLFRTFTFTDGKNSLAFSDLESRLLGPQRTAFDIFPTTDFSPFAQLSRLLENAALREKLKTDLANNRFDYPKWLEMARPRRARPSQQAAI